MIKDQQWYEDEFWNWMPIEFNYSDKWSEISEAYLSNAPVSRNLPYGEKPAEVFDLFVPPEKKKNAPVLIFIHGGYWGWLDKDDYAFSLEPLRSAGAIVVSINYTLCPENTIPGIVKQVRQACVYVYSNIEQFNGDPSNIHVTGHSAGGHLTAMIAATDWKSLGADLPGNLIKSAIPSSGIFNLNSIRLTPPLNEVVKLNEDTADQNSPIFLDPTYDLRMTVVVGADESEGFILESKEFVTSWHTKLTRIQYIEIPNVHHFSLIESMINEDDPFTNVILDHLELGSCGDLS